MVLKKTNSHKKKFHKFIIKLDLFTLQLDMLRHITDGNVNNLGVDKITE